MRHSPCLCLLSLCLWLCGPAFADNAFRWVTEPAFEDAGSAHRGVVPLFQDGLWGLMGADGRWRAPPSFEAVGAAGDGRFAVQKGGKWGAVDLNGQLVIPLDFDAIGTPDELTPVLWQGAWIALDRQAVQVGESLAFDTLVGNDGRCLTGTANGRPVLDWRGNNPKVFLPDGIDRVFAPAEGYAVVNQAGKLGLMDCAYGVVTNGAAEHDDMRRLSAGMAAVKAGTLWGYTGLYGGFEIDPRFTAAREFSSGLAPVQVESGLWGYADRRGQLVIAPQFDQAYSFADGIAGVQIGEARGFITPDFGKTGRFAAEPQFQDFWRHDGGVLPVQLGDLWGVIGLEATDPATRFNLPLATAATPAEAQFSLIPSAPHWYFAQDVVSLHSMHLASDGRHLLTVLNNSSLGEVALWDRASHRLVRKIAVAEVTQAVLLPEAVWIVAGTSDGQIVLLEAATGIERHRMQAHEGAVIDMAISPDGRMLASLDGSTLRLWSLENGRAVGQIAVAAHKLRFSAASDTIVAASVRGGIWQFGLDGTLQREIPEGPPLEFGDGPYTSAVTTMALGPGGVLAVVRTGSVQQSDGFFAEVNRIEITDTSGRRDLPVAEGITLIQTLDISDDGSRIAYAGLRDEDFSVVVEVRRVADGATLFSQTLDRQDPGDGIARWMFAVDRLGFAPGGDRLVLIGSEGSAIVEYDPAEGRMTGAFGEPLVEGFPNIGPQDGLKFFVSDGGGAFWVWDLAEGRLAARVPLGEPLGSEQMLDLQGEVLFLHDALDGGATRVDLQALTARPASPDEEAQSLERMFAEAGTPDHADALARLPGGGLGAVALAQGRIGILSEGVGLHRAYDLASGALLVQFLATPDGDWLMLTPEGFFAASANGARLVSVSTGVAAFSVDQVYQALYRPDLVRAKLAGDPDGAVATAARGLNLGLILETGPAPRTRFALPLQGAKAADEMIDVAVELTDEGGGVGRVEWRVNGLTVGVQARGAMSLADEPEGMLARTRVALEPGENVIEVVAYNAAGLLASSPQNLTVVWDGVASLLPPALHVLAVGVNDYADGRLRLNYATADAQAFGSALERTGAGLFSEVHVTTLLDAQVTEAGLDAAFASLGAVVKPQDVFLFFLAGHGKTVDGVYHFIPQDFRFDGDDPVRQRGISQDRWQEWASRVKARKSVMIYDTCESGSLTGTRSLDSAMAQSAAVERLTRATGRTILAASTDDAPALEGYRGHGMLTYALLSALDEADANGNATIEVTELAGYIDQTVPDLSAAAFGLRQVPQMSIRGSDFALGQRLAVLGATAEVRFPKTLTHVVAGGTAVLDAPGGAGLRTIDTGIFFGVHLIEQTDGWARIAKDGTALGWVPAATLTPLQ